MGIGSGLAMMVLLAAIGPDRRPIPEPPQQGKPWTAPGTRLPRFLVSATGALFAEGVADPRGCEYREVVFDQPKGMWRGAKPVRQHAFVLPAVDGDDRRFAAGWDGQVSRVQEIGPAADLASDIRTWCASLREGRAEAAHGRSSQPGSWFWRYGPSRKNRPTEVVPPLRLCLLLRLGRADLAESLFAAATPWTSDGPRPDLTDYGVSYLTLATEWANDLYVRGVDAHGRGDDGLALDTLRRVAAFRQQAEAKATAMGFPRPPAHGLQREGPPTYFPDLHQLDELLADQRRRAHEPARGPIPGRDADPAARVAALILNLDEIAVHHRSVPGVASPGSSPLVRELIALGDAAVEPLLEALIHDHRLTRSISYGRGMGQQRFVSPTIDAILSALDGLMRTGVPGITSEMRYRPDAGRRRAMAEAYRKFWETNRAVPPEELYYRILADDAAAARWLEAANGLTAPAPDASGRPRHARPDQPPPPMLGEPLRQGREPSITALMIRRTEEQARRATRAFDFRDACGIAAALAKWDLRAALPVLHAMMDRARELYAQEQASDNWSRPWLARNLASFTLTRTRAGDRAALDEYAAWIRMTTPETLKEGLRMAFEPMWTEPDHPTIAEATQAMFAPGSAWTRSLTDLSPGHDPFGHDALETSPLIRVPAFRDAVISGLADRAEGGTVERKSDQPGSVSFTIDGSQSGGFGTDAMADLDELPIGEKRPVRAGDWLALRLAALEGAPLFQLYWKEARRDEAIARLITFLRRYGDRYEAVETAAGSPGNPRLAFPPLGRPATAADVEAGRAIFSLEGEGAEVRVVPLPEVPLRALWTTVEDTPRITQTDSEKGDSQTRRDFDRSGRVWQAEEVRVGDRWKRFFGFVGAHTVRRAPADEIRLYEPPYFWGPVKGRLGAKSTLVNPPKTFEEGVRPGEPLVVSVRLRNLTGLDQSVPTEFIRPDADGKPALRSGITLKLTRAEIRPEELVGGLQEPRHAENLAPKRDARFTPGNATRVIGPAETFEAFRLDLRDWFTVSRPGQYQFGIEFSEDLDVAPSNSSLLYFRLSQ
jgi:hypothetical protein